ncbi:hypothetical protein XI09_30260 [Bradyrhizobium sp. CCBAU 11386]|nr:hypothetical protein [Bradyrhizobium sp. CCBAU 11386]
MVKMSLASRSAWYFLSPIAGAGISLLVLPLSTRVIGAEEYGALAVAAAVAAMLNAMAAAAIGFVLSENYLRDEMSGVRGEIACAAVLAAVGGALAGLVIFWPVTELLLPHLLVVNDVLARGMRICLLGAVIGSPWVVCVELFMLEGRARAFAVGTIAQALVNGCMVLILLYIRPMPDLALFAGNFAGQVVLAAVGVTAIASRLRWPRDGRWFATMLSKAVPVGRASLAEAGRSLFERGYLGAWTSVSDVGLYSHAHLYRSWAMLTLNAVSRATWPINLAEAQAAEPTFVVTRASWAIVQAGVGGVAMLFALFGGEIISVLSSGKFVAAKLLAVILLASLLIQTTGKPDTALLIARGRGQFVANAATAGIIAGIIAMLALLPLYGALGAALAVVVQMLVTRGFLVYASRRIYPLPFADGWVLFGLGGTAALYGWTSLAAPGIILRALAMAAVIAAIAGVLRSQALVFFRYRSAPSPPPSTASAVPDRHSSAHRPAHRDERRTNTLG